MDHAGQTEAFETVVGGLDYPMFVVTTRAGDRLAGCLVGFASQTSINPARFLVGLSKKNRTFRVAMDAQGLVVHVLSPSNLETAELFGGQTGDEVDKFAKCHWSDGPMGIPVLADAVGWFSGRVIERFDLGDHMAFLLEPSVGEVRGEIGELMTFQDVRHLEPGHEA